MVRFASEERGDLLAVGVGKATVWLEVGDQRDSVSIQVAGTQDVPSHKWKAVATYATGTCALDIDGYAYCWGDDFWGGWGDGGDRRQWTNAHRPVRVNSALQFESISKGLGTACARTADGEVWCWGWHNGSHLGHRNTDASYETSPVRVDFGDAASALTTGPQHSCLLDTSARAHCWGSNLGYQLGVNDDITSTKALGGGTAPVAFEGGFESLSGRGYYTCGVSDTRELYCWGSVPVGSGQSAMLPAPVRIPTEQSPAAVAVGNGNGCMLSDSGEAYCWGSNVAGQAGRAPDAGSDTPVRVETDLRFQKLSLSGGLTCGLDASGQMWCWGTGDALDPETAGSCGEGALAIPCTSTPQPFGGHLRFQDLSSGEALCAVTLDGELYCWGANERGQLGIGHPDTVITHTPTRVLDPA